MYIITHKDKLLANRNSKVAQCYTSIVHTLNCNDFKTFSFKIQMGESILLSSVDVQTIRYSCTWT